VLRLLADEDPNVQEAAAFAASLQPTPSRVIPTLTEWTRKGPTQTQYAAISALASLARPAVTKNLDRLSRNEIRRTLVSLAAHPSANVRVQIARGLDLPESEAARAALKRLTVDTDLRVRLAALTSYRFPGVDFLTGPLETALLSQDIRMNRVGLQALEGVNTAAATSRLVEAIVDLRNPWLKEGVIRAIRRMEPSLAVRLANGLSKEPLARHRAAALAALEYSHSAETKAFADMLWADSDPRVRAALVPTRLQNGLANSEAELQAALDDPGISVERALTKTAGRIFLRQTTSSEDRLIAARILRTMWDRENERDTRELRLDILRTIERGTKDQKLELGDLLKRASKDKDARIRRAAERSGAPGDSTAEDPAFDLATCRKIAAWAMVPRELEATVERPGFPTGRFRIRLDVENAPRASWWFAEQAAQGKWDNRLIDDLVPADFLRIGDADPGEDRRYPPAPLSEIGIVRYRAGTVALTGMGPDRPDARLFIALTARLGDFGRYTQLGTVASNNFVGVVWNLLPGDRMLRLRPVEEESN
jgi:HEAT repeat protein/cyclophilin family peptidyl-prolyl cis-trans isomerase